MLRIHIFRLLRPLLLKAEKLLKFQLQRVGIDTHLLREPRTMLELNRNQRYKARRNGLDINSYNCVENHAMCGVTLHYVWERTCLWIIIRHPHGRSVTYILRSLIRGATTRSSLIKFVARRARSASNDNVRDARLAPFPSPSPSPPSYPPAFRCTRTISSGASFAPSFPFSALLLLLFLPTLPPLGSLTDALIIPCLQSAELCAWEYKKMRHRARNTTGHFAYRREFNSRF